MCHDHNLIKAVRCSLTRSTTPICARAPDDDRMDPSPRNGHFAIVSDANVAVTLLAKDKICGNIVTHERKKQKRASIKGGAP